MRTLASRHFHIPLLVLLAAGVGGGCSATPHRHTVSPGQPREPMMTAPRPRAVVSAHGMVIAGAPEAARAGALVLEEGGTAVDAAVATIFALMPTDISSVGPASDMVMVLHTSDGTDIVFDSPSFAPIRVQPQALQTMKREGSMWGRRLSTVPTLLAVLGTVQERYATWDLPRLTAPAIEIAREGFELGFYQRMAIREYREIFLNNPVGAAMLHFQANGDIPPVHTRIAFPGLVATLERISEAGWRDFYRGRLATAIESDMRAHGGWITRADLARVPVRVREIKPVHMSYRGRRVVAPGPPWGGPALLEALEILRCFPDHLLTEDSTDHVHLMIEATRLAQYDQLRQVRRNLIPSSALQETALPSGASALARQIDFTRKVPVGMTEREPAAFPSDRNTTQIDVLDSRGNAVSATVTLGRYFGCKTGSPRLGFFYNSLLEGFQYDDPSLPQYPHPLSQVQSYMAPTIVLGEDGSVLVLGTGGSGRITSFLLEVLSNVLDRGMTLERAVAHPRIDWTGPQEKSVELEVTPPLRRGVAAELKRRGFQSINIITYPATLYDRAHLGGVDCAAFDPASGQYTGVGDPRREGFAAGPAR